VDRRPGLRTVPGADRPKPTGRVMDEGSDHDGDLLFSVNMLVV
jgi:hypothetical protein